MLIDTRIQDIQYHAAKLIYILAGDNKQNYDSFKRTEVFEFFRLLWIHEDLMAERLKQAKKQSKKKEKKEKEDEDAGD